MKKDVRRLSAIRDAGRLINLRDILARVGTLLYRRSLRYGLIALAFSVVGFISHQLGLPGLTKQQAIGFPIVVGSGACLLGLLLRFVPTVISARLQTVAQAADLNLMEDYRKKRAAHYLVSLWDRVYRYEAELFYSPEEREAEAVRLTQQKQILQAHLAGLPPELRRQLGEPDTSELAEAILALSPVSSGLPKTREAFLLEGRYTLHSYKTQTEERAETGVDFSAFEDWCDGAFFDRSDTKLIEQYGGDPVLCTVKNLIRLPLRLQLAELWIRFSQRLWFLIAVRALALEVATAVEYLNALYGTTIFNAQTLLWPGAEEDQEVRRLGAEEPVRKWRERVLSRVFGKTPEEWTTMVDRMFFGTYVLATHLRMFFDPEYCDGSLDYDLCSDVEAEGCCDQPFYRGFADKARQDLLLLEAYLRAYRPEVFEDPEGLRTVKITFHLNRLGFKDDFFKMRSFQSGKIWWHIDRALRRKSRYTVRLRRVRQFHELARLQLLEYRNLVSTLMGRAA